MLQWKRKKSTNIYKALAFRIPEHKNESEVIPLLPKNLIICRKKRFKSNPIAELFVLFPYSTEMVCPYTGNATYWAVTLCYVFSDHEEEGNMNHIHRYDWLSSTLYPTAVCQCYSGTALSPILQTGKLRHRRVSYGGQHPGSHSS